MYESRYMLYESLEHICCLLFSSSFSSSVQRTVYCNSLFFHFRLLLKRLWLRQCLLIHFKKFSVIDHLYLCSLLLCVYIYIFIIIVLRLPTSIFTSFFLCSAHIYLNGPSQMRSFTFLHQPIHICFEHSIKLAIFSPHFFIIFFPSKLQYNRFIANTFPCILIKNEEINKTLSTRRCN